MKIAKTLLLTTLTLINFSAAQAANHIERLFTTPQEREHLNDLRTQSIMPSKTPNPSLVQSYVKRSDGISTLWLNQKPSSQTTVKSVKDAQAE